MRNYTIHFNVDEQLSRVIEDYQLNCKKLSLLKIIIRVDEWVVESALLVLDLHFVIQEVSDIYWLQKLHMYTVEVSNYDI